MDQRKTVVRSFRIEKELNDSLENLARGQDLTLNSLVSSVLTKYVEWDSKAARFGFVSVPRELFRELIYADGNKQFEEVGRELGPRLSKEIMHFWYKRIGTQSFADYMRLLSKYSGLAQADVETDGRESVLTYRHQLGERWSRFAAAYYAETLRSTLGVEPKADLSSGQIVLRWGNILAPEARMLGGMHAGY